MLRQVLVLCAVLVATTAQPAAAVPPTHTTYTETIPLTGTFIECPLEVVAATSGTTTLTVSVTTRSDPARFEVRVHTRSSGRGIGLVSQVTYMILSQDISVLSIYPGLKQTFFVEHKLISLAGLPDATLFSQYHLEITPNGVPVVTRERTECRQTG
ncbi:MAG TPA: hypothetical protein VFW12_09505 [Candidatus Limnocylindria bacterium]|nr:hypothetical protein [Candidatus Limnocylindria bacterium]